MEQAVVAGGCFWCLEPVFRALSGVLDVRPGYCGGQANTANYEQVCEGNTGHVEAVQIDYDPAVIDYPTLLRVFFDAHDPTTQDRQGNDVGPQYASVVFAQGAGQYQQAVAARDAAQAQHTAPIVTRIEPAATFWPAEAIHHDYYRRFPAQPYCQLVIAPKMLKLRRSHAELLGGL